LDQIWRQISGASMISRAGPKLLGVDRHREFPFLEVDLLGLLEDHAVGVVYGFTAR
jgi:hypothetical protein